MGLLFEAGSIVRLIAGFPRVGEGYGVDWQPVKAFLDDGWRASWPLDFFRAHGELLPVEHPDDDGRRMVRFLDGAPHPEQAAARERLEAERAKAQARRLDATDN